MACGAGAAVSLRLGEAGGARQAGRRCSSVPADYAAHRLVFFGDLFFWHLAIFGTSVANATFFATTAPIFVAAIGFFFLGKRISRPELLGIALCVVGGGLLVWDTLGGAAHRLTGDLFAIATAFFFGIYFITVEKARLKQGPGG